MAPQSDRTDEPRPAPESDEQAPAGSTGERPPLEVPEPGLPQARVDYVYRIFCAKKDMPKLEDLLARLIAQNPHNPEGGYVFAPPQGLRRIQDALGASADYFVMGYLREEAPQLWEEAAAVLGEQGAMLDERERLTVRESPLCIVIRAQIANPENNDFVETLIHLADAFRDLCFGVVWDVHMRRMWTADEWSGVLQAMMSPLSHVRVLRSPEGGGAEDAGGTLTLRTSGLIKFGSADLELDRVPQDLASEASAFLLDAAEELMHGDLLEPDEVLTYRDVRMRTVAARERTDAANEVLRLADAPADPEAELPETDGSEGAPALLGAIRKARVEVEGERAFRNLRG